MPKDIPRQTKEVDQPAWALVQDLKSRGLLEDTLVIWGGEFGRTIYSQGALTTKKYGRDHHPKCFTMWLTGGGIHGGVTHGETDEFSYNIVRDPVHIRDLHATILHLLGIDHEQLTFYHNGIERRLTNVHGEVIDDDRFTVKHRGLDERLTGVQEKARVVTPILA